MNKMDKELVTFNMPKHEKVKLIKLAIKDGRSVSSYVRLLIKEKINEDEARNTN